MGLLNGPVKNALFCFMDRYQNVCVWFMARSCRVPEVGTHASQPGSHGLPVTIAKNFQFLKVGTDGSQRGNQRLPWQGTAGSETLKLTVPNLGTRGYHLLQGIAGSQTLEYMSSKLSGYHCKAAGSQSLKLMVPNLKK